MREFSRSFYHSKEWQETREFILKRDHYICQWCGKPAKEVHHKIRLSPSNIGDVRITMNPDNLISLCRDCHMDEHRQEKIAGTKTKQTKRDCGDDFFFDENGMLQKKESPPV